MDIKSAVIANDNSLSLAFTDTAPSGSTQRCFEAMDVHSFRDRAGDDESLMCELIELFCSDYPRQLADIRRAVHSGNASELSGAAHALKGAVANFSAEPAVRAAARLENMGRTDDLSGAADCYAELANELSRLDSALQKVARDIRQ